MWLRSALMLYFGFVLGVGNVAAANHDWPPGVWQDLDKVHVRKFIAESESRKKVIEKINEVLHKAAPDTKIKISFIPSDLPEIDEAKYARSIHINVHDCTVADLLQLVAMYDVDWKVTGNNVVGSQARTD